VMREFFAMIMEEAMKGLDALDSIEAEELLGGIEELVRTAKRHLCADEIPEEVRKGHGCQASFEIFVRGSRLPLVDIFLYLLNAALKFRLVGYSLFEGSLRN